MEIIIFSELKIRFELLIFIFSYLIYLVFFFYITCH